jgi:hypothetical protein
MKTFLFIVALFVFVSPAAAQSTPNITPDGKFGWDMPAPTLADAQEYRYTAYVGTATTGVVMTATCTGTVSPFACVSALPVTIPGEYSVRVAAQQLLGENTWAAETRSDPYIFRVVPPTAQPGRLRVSLQ